MTNAHTNKMHSSTRIYTVHTVQIHMCEGPLYTLLNEKKLTS